jgi:hypothetical protein
LIDVPFTAVHPGDCRFFRLSKNLTAVKSVMLAKLTIFSDPVRAYELCRADFVGAEIIFLVEKIYIETENSVIKIGKLLIIIKVSSLALRLL